MEREEVWLEGEAGIRIVADRVGHEGAPAVVMVHGGGQTRWSWKNTAVRIADAGFRVWSLDARGHGTSDWSAAGDYRMDAMRNDLASAIRQVGGDAIIVGASMGGIMGLLVAGECDPTLCRGLILVDVAPRVNPAGRDRIHGFMRAHAGGFTDLAEASAAVAVYVGRPSSSASTDGLRRNLRERDGRLFWHWDPRFLDTWDFGAATSGRAEAAARSIRVPLLLVHAGLSDVVREEEVAAFRALVPDADYVRVADAGHMVAGERNDRFTRLIVNFLRDRFAPERAATP